MGPMPVMEEINLDDIDLIDDTSLKALKKDDNNDDDDEGDDEDAFASDVKDIYDELRGTNDYLPVNDLKDWEDIQDMLENGEITIETIDKVTNFTITIEQHHHITIIIM